MKGADVNLRHRRGVLEFALAVTASFVILAACASPAPAGGSPAPAGGTPAPGGTAPVSQEPVATATEDPVDAALEAGGTITYWTWTNAEPQVEAFEKEYPNVDVKLANVGTAQDHYTKLQNVIAAGSGAPDVAQVEYYALPQFALPGHLVDLRQFGFDQLATDFTPSDWAAARVGEGLYGLPQGGGPMVLFYNKRIFDEHDLTVPTTWDEFLANARKLKESDPTKYFTGDPGEPGQDLGLIWQAGGRPFKVDGTRIAINFDDEGTARWTAIWNQLLAEDHLAPSPHWTEEWFAGLADGTIATLPFGGWQAGVFAAFEDGVGDWRVAPMPTYDGGETVSSHHGGSNQAVLEQSKSPALAAGFLRWLNHEEGATVYRELGGFPATVADLTDPEFIDHEWEFFGGQQVNQLIVEAAEQVGEGWQFLPYQSYANSIFGDTAGQSFLSKSDINVGLKAWQDALIDYGNQQGFEVDGG